MTQNLYISSQKILFFFPFSLILPHYFTQRNTMTEYRDSARQLNVHGQKLLGVIILKRKKKKKKREREKNPYNPTDTRAGKCSYCKEICIIIIQTTLKVIPPIYFHGNCNRYKKHDNTIFQHSHHHQQCIFASDEQEPAYCTEKSAQVEVTHLLLLKHTTHHLTVLTSTAWSS